MADDVPFDNHSSEAEDELPALQADPTILKSPDLMIWTSGGDNGGPKLSVPPPHIAQRFYRPGLNRRRSSAASSRRNSMTSSHSHQSNRSYRTACYRSHIDHHLRRASILEDRKARLANRAAHVEQVRIRAALAKAAPRGSNTEEKALAAEQARERHLAKVAAACAEEVNRAKRVAEDNKARLATEEKRHRQELEDKHAEVERRRLEYKRHSRRPRTTSMAIAEEARPDVLRLMPTEPEAASCIQRAWRRVSRKKALDAFSKLNLSTDRIRQATFEEAMNLLADENVISCTGRILRLFDLNAGSGQDLTPARTFLSAFMMLGHPNTIFSKNGQQEQDLIGKAKDLLIPFESGLSSCTSSSSATASQTQLQTLHQAHATYTTAFAAWKSGDASIFVETMVDQFVALDGIWQTVKDDTAGDAANDYRDAIRTEQVKLLSRLKKLAGADRANALIKRGIRESRRQRPRNRPLGDVRPRPLANVDTATSTAPIANEDLVGGPDQQTQSQPEGFELIELSRLFSIIPPNRSVVHELMIDRDFRIEVSPDSDVRNAMNRKVCDSMRKGVQEGQGEIWTIAMAQNIRERLLKIPKEGNNMHRLLSEVLDLDHIRTQCRQGQFSYDKFFLFMANILPQMCAPVRDEEVKALGEVLKSPTQSTDAMIEKLFGLLHVIDLLSLDYTNFLISQRADVLIREGPGYEQRLFQSELDNGSITLARTTRWWRNATVNILTETTTHDSAPARPSFPRIYARGLVDLAVGATTLREADIPETLGHDATRLSRIRTDMLRVVLVGGVLSTAKNLLRRDVRAQWKPEARRIFDSLKDGYADDAGELAARILAVIESGHGMPANSREHLAAFVRRCLREAAAGQLADPVLKVQMQRLKSHLFSRLAAQSSIERVRVASTTSEGLAAIGLGEFIGAIGAAADELGHLIQVDLQCHELWVNRVAEEVEGLGSS